MRGELTFDLGDIESSNLSPIRYCVLKSEFFTRPSDHVKSTHPSELLTHRPCQVLLLPRRA